VLFRLLSHRIFKRFNHSPLWSSHHLLPVEQKKPNKVEFHSTLSGLMTLYEIQRALTHFHELRNIKKFKTPSEAARLDACSLLRHCQKRQTKGSKTKYEKLIRRRRLFFFLWMQSSSCKRFGKYCFRFVSGQVVGFAAALFFVEQKIKRVMRFADEGQTNFGNELKR
jgi:hypothetical protein